MATEAPLRPPYSDSSLEHSATIRGRLRRIEGQVAGIERMYDSGRPCPEILDQLAAARAALESVALLVLEDHLDGCLEPIVHSREADRRAAELMLAVRRFVRTG